MTIDISNNAARVNYTVAQGATQTSFSVPFEFFNDADLSVYVDDVLKTITTHYTVSGGDGSTGTVTISVTGASGGSIVVISRSIAIERTSDFVTGVDINRAALNTQLDTLTAIAADNKDKASRSISAPNSEVNPQLELPDADTRKGKLVGFNETTGNVELSATLADGNTLASISGDIATLADIEDGTDATDAIQTVAGISSDVTTVAGISANVTSVAGNSSNINTVAADGADIGTVAVSIASVNTNAANITDIQNASANAATATTKASEAATSATNAATSETNAATSESNAATSASTATTQAGISTTKAGEASVSAAAALASEGAASTSETNSANSAANSSNSATLSEASRIASVAAQAAAETAETNAETAETNAAASASSASTSASNASTSETNAATSASTATTQAGIATTKAGEAATSATASANSATASEAAKDAALAALDNFDDRYLGAKASDPTVDNDGNPLISGALYFNTTDDVMKVYEGSQWVAAYASLSGALLVNNNLSDVADAAGSRTNLGLGTAATAAATDFVAVTGDSMTGDLSFGDNDKAIFGAGSDLQIYHDGSNSYISDQGTGNIILDADDSFQVKRGANYSAYFDTNAEVTLYHNNSAKLATTSSGCDINGTLTSDNGSSTTVLSGNSLVFDRNSANYIRTSDASGYLRLQTGSGDTAFFSANGDISFYEDTGTTPKFFWDASAEALGIGTTSTGGETFVVEKSSGTPTIRINAPSGSQAQLKLQADGTVTDTQMIHANTDASLGFSRWDGAAYQERMRIDSSGDVLFLGGTLRIKDSGNTAQRGAIYGNASEFHLNSGVDNMVLTTSGGEAMRIDSIGNVGIGCVPNSIQSGFDTLQIGGNLTLNVDSTGVGAGVYMGNNVYRDSGNSRWEYINTDEATQYIQANGEHIWRYAASGSANAAISWSEAARLDASGNFLVGKSSVDTTTDGLVMRERGQVYATSNGNTPVILNRRTSDGDITQFRKDNTTVGSIGVTDGDNLFISSTASAHGGLKFNNTAMAAYVDGANSDGTMSIGTSVVRFKDLYLSGTANAANFNTTSDATLKTNVETLSGSLDAVKSLRGVSFDWLENGGSEIGVIAQEVEAVLPDVVSTNDEGIKSVKYGNMVAVLIEAIKEQQLRIEALEAKLGD